MATASALAARRRLVAAVNRSRPKEIKAALWPSGVAIRYQRFLSELMRDAVDSVDEIVLPQLETLVGQQELLTGVVPRSDALSDDIERLMGLIRVRFLGLFSDRRLSAIAETIAADVATFNKDELQRTLINAVGVDLIGSEPYLEQQIKMFVNANVGLIRRLEESTINQIEQIVTRGVTTGLRHETIADQLVRQLGIDASRAELIARDQVSKFNANLTRLRHRRIGITRYRWITARDERVSTGRFGHARLDYRTSKRTYSYEDPPAAGRDGSPANPGEAINCRCIALPIVEGLNE